ncbi:hypothetical protein ATCC90586_009183 [Pythium insidiosum]|nr:hypothetical protein ATCC90586_009183 [Pythium insidiosum]
MGRSKTKPPGRPSLKGKPRTTPGRRRRSFKLRTKIDIVEFFKNSSMPQTHEKFFSDLSPEAKTSMRKRVYEWADAYEELKCRFASEAAGEKRCFREGSAGTMLHPTIERGIVDWINAHRKEGVPVSALMLQLYAREVAVEHGITGFIASWSWHQGFMNRQKLTPATTVFDTFDEATAYCEAYFDMTKQPLRVSRTTAAGIFALMVLSYDDELIYASSEIQYEKTLSFLEALIPKEDGNTFINYFRKNWDAKREMWAKVERDDIPHLGNHTNNRIESSWSHLKPDLDTNLPIDEAVAEIIDCQLEKEKAFDEKYEYAVGLQKMEALVRAAFNGGGVGASGVTPGAVINNNDINSGASTGATATVNTNGADPSTSGGASTSITNTNTNGGATSSGTINSNVNRNSGGAAPGAPGASATRCVGGSANCGGASGTITNGASGSAQVTPGTSLGFNTGRSMSPLANTISNGMASYMSSGGGAGAFRGYRD